MVANNNWIEFVCSLLTRIVKSEPFSISMFSSLGQLLAAGNLPECHIMKHCIQFFLESNRI